MAYAQNHQPFLAAADLDAALSLAPDDADAHITRASLRLDGDDPAGAITHVDAVDKSVPAQDERRLTLGQLYEAARAYGPAGRQFDLWIKARPDDARMAVASNGRCWMGAMLGTDLDAALAACDRAVKRSARTAAFPDSRGLVHVRRGEPEKAIGDYNTALALNPRIAWSLYGEALAERRKGMLDEAKADFAADAVLDPKIGESATAVGLGS